MTPAQWKAYVSAFKKGQAEIKAQTMAQLNSQIALYKQHGKNIAKAIVAGITSEDRRLQTAIERMLRREFGLKPTKNFKPSPRNVTIHHETHYHGAPSDVRTRTLERHNSFRIRAHLSGKFG
jgi:hypothetical protein